MPGFLNMQAADKELINRDIWTISNAGVPTDSVTGAGQCGKGSLCVDYTNGKLYINGGTKAAPVWKLVTSAA